MQGKDDVKAFSPVEVMGLKLRNRFVRSATLENMATEKRSPGDEIIRIYVGLAEGGVGMISVSATLPDPAWATAFFPRQLMLHKTSDLKAWEALVQAVHEQGAKLSLQMSPPAVIEGKPAAPFEYGSGVHALSIAEIREILSAYASMAELARKLEIDAVQIHAGHGYCLSRFLSPHYNRRDDIYGGSMENRIRLFVEIREAVTAAAGPDFPVWIKLNTMDGILGSVTPELSAGYASLLSAAGYGMIEASGGDPAGGWDARGPRDKKMWYEGYFLAGAAAIKAAARLPVVAVGGIRTLKLAEDILSSGKADLIAFSRPLIREPALINRWAGGNRSRSLCISCDGCTRLRDLGKGLICALEKRNRNK